MKIYRAVTGCWAVPIKGLSDVIGIIEETVLRNIVRDNRMVTPAIVLRSENISYISHGQSQVSESVLIVTEA